MAYHSEHKRAANKRRPVLAAGLFCATVLAQVSPALAQPAAGNPFSSLVERPKTTVRGADGVVQRFVTAADNRVFLFEGRGATGLVRFLCAEEDPRVACKLDEDYPAEEIILLKATRAPRGDTLFRDETGRAVLRLTPYGNATVYWPGQAIGAAATKTFSDDLPLALAPVGAGAVRGRAQKATAFVSAKIGAPVLFETPSLETAAPTDARARVFADEAPSLTAVAETEAVAAFALEKATPVLADAIVRTADAIAAVARDKTGRRVLAARLTHVRFEEGPAAAVRLDEGALIVTVNEDAGFQGRLSSAAIVSYLEENL